MAALSQGPASPAGQTPVPYLSMLVLGQGAKLQAGVGDELRLLAASLHSGNSKHNFQNAYADTFYCVQAIKVIEVALNFERKHGWYVQLSGYRRALSRHASIKALLSCYENESRSPWGFMLQLSSANSYAGSEPLCVVSLDHLGARTGAQIELN